MKITFRQGVVSYPRDINGAQDFLKKTGDNITLFITAQKELMVTIAHKNTDYLHIENQTTQDAWVGPFSSSKNYWLYIDLNTTTGKRTFGYTSLAPIVSGERPAQPFKDQHWYDLTDHTMKIWSGMGWLPVIRVFVGKYERGTRFKCWCYRRWYIRWYSGKRSFRVNVWVSGL